jgi:hypothetical protein
MSIFGYLEMVILIYLDKFNTTQHAIRKGESVENAIQQIVATFNQPPF